MEISNLLTYNKIIQLGHHSLDHHHVVYFNEMMSAVASVSNPRRQGLPGDGHASVRSGQSYFDKGKASPLHLQQPREERAKRTRSTSNLRMVNQVYAGERKKQLLQMQDELHEAKERARSLPSLRPVDGFAKAAAGERQKQAVNVKQPYADLEALLDSDSDSFEQEHRYLGARGKVGASNPTRPNQYDHTAGQDHWRRTQADQEAGEDAPDEESPFEFKTVTLSGRRRLGAFPRMQNDSDADSPYKDGGKLKDQYDSAQSFSRKLVHKGGMLSFLFEDDDVDAEQDDHDSEGSGQRDGAHEQAWPSEEREQLQMPYEASPAGIGQQPQRFELDAASMARHNWNHDIASNDLGAQRPILPYNQMQSLIDLGANSQAPTNWSFAPGSQQNQTGFFFRAQAPQDVLAAGTSQSSALLQQNLQELEMLQKQLPAHQYAQLICNEQFMYSQFLRERALRQQQTLPHQYQVQQPTGLFTAPFSSMLETANAGRDAQTMLQAAADHGTGLPLMAGFHPQQLYMNHQQQQHLQFALSQQQRQMQQNLLQQWHLNAALAAQNNDPYRGHVFGVSPKPINQYERLFMERVAAKLGFSGNHSSAFKVAPGYQRLFDIDERAAGSLHRHALDSEAARALNGTTSSQFNAFHLGQQQNFSGSNLEMHGQFSSASQGSNTAFNARAKRSNRLLETTRGLQAAHDNLHKYRRARQEVLEKIRRGRDKPAANYIGNAANDESHGESPPCVDEWQQLNSEGKDLGGLGQQAKRVGQFTDTLRREKATRKEQHEFQEIGLGSGGEYVLRRDQILVSPEGHQYKIIGYLGQGTFGQVVKCINMQTGSQHAIKIIKNKQEFILQGLVEAKILEKLNECRTEFEKQHLIKMQDYFVFRDYLCIVFELLSKSLYTIVQETDRGLPLHTVRDYVRQILEALVACESANLIHCDVKPENILVAEDGVNVKLIDFGNATFNGQQVYTYIQSRYYRAPEVLMGSYKVDQATGKRSPFYDQSIDMWSVGCTAIELFIKTPIFPGMHDYDQMLKIQEFCGQPPIDLISNSLNRDKFFLFNYFQRCYMFKTFQQFLAALQPQGNYTIPQNYHQYLNFCQLLESHHILKLKKQAYDYALAQKLPVPPRFDMMQIEYSQGRQQEIYQFIDFVQQILQVDPRQRLTPLQALSHPFITGEATWTLPFRAAPNHQLRQFREAVLLNHGHAISRQARHVPRPMHKFNMQEFFKYDAQLIQRNGAESFRPALSALPEELFFGNCQETLKSFLEESKIRFQIHQDEYMQAQIYRQSQLLQGHHFCDKVIESCGLAGLLDADDVGETQPGDVSAWHQNMRREQSKKEIQADKSIIQPKSQVLSGNPQAFIRDILQKDIIGRLEKHQQQNNSEQPSARNRNCVHYQSSQEFQMLHFEDFFIGPEEEKFKLEAIDEQRHDDNDSCCKRDDADDFKKMSKVTTLCDLSDTLSSHNGQRVDDEEGKNVSSIFCDQEQWGAQLKFTEMRADIEKFNKERSGSSDDLQRNQPQHSSAQQVTAAGHFSQVFGIETTPKPFYVPETRNGVDQESSESEDQESSALLTPAIQNKYQQLIAMKHKSSPARAIGYMQGVVGSFHDQTPKHEKEHSSSQKEERKLQEESDDASDIDTEQDTEHVRYAKQRREAWLENTDSIEQEEVKAGERLDKNCSSRKTEQTNREGTEDDNYDEGPWLLSSTLSDGTGGFGGGRHRNLSNSFEDRQTLLGEDSDQLATSDKTSIAGSSFKRGGGIPYLRNFRLGGVGRGKSSINKKKKQQSTNELKDQGRRRGRPITRADTVDETPVIDPKTSMPEQ